MTTEPCSCELAGYCARHKMNKHQPWFKLCQNSESYRAAWDSGNGPGQNLTPPSIPEPVQTYLGPGTILHNYLSSIGIQVTSNCSCNSYRRTMDQWGPEICRTKIHVIVQWLREEANKRKLPFVTLAANLLVKWVIHQSEKSLQNSKAAVDKDLSTS